MKLQTCVTASILFISGAVAAFSQTTSAAHPTPIAATAPTAVPALVPFSGVALTPGGKPLSGDVTATILLFKDELGGEPLWSESQSVSVDASGRYQVQLGASSPSGLPLNLFAAGEGRWIDVVIPGQAVQPRVLLMSVPYAMKSADAATLGGLPPSAFALAAPSATPTANSPLVTPETTGNAVTTPGGTNGYIPTFTGSATIANSTVFLSGSKIGLSTTAPAATLDVNGSTINRGLLTLPAAGTATSSTGDTSQPLDFVASAYNSSTPAVVSPTFQLKAEPTANDTSAPAASLNLLYNGNAGTPAETGLSIASNGLITFAKNQTFPGTGTITSLVAASPLVIGGANGALNVSLNTSALESTLNGKYIQASAANHFTGLNTFAGTSTFNGPTSFTQPVTFASGQTFGTGAGSGTITGVTAGTGLTGGGTSGKVTVAINNSVVPTLSGANSFTSANQFTTISASSPAVYGENTDTQSDPTSGVYGKADSPYGQGVYGVLVGTSSTGSTTGGAAGVWGDTKSTTGAANGRFPVGVLGTADGGEGAEFINNSGNATTLFVHQFGSSNVAYFEGAQGYCYVDNSGDLSCSGSKSAVVPVDKSTRQVALYAVESPENWFEDFGSGQLTSGSAAISFEQVFAQTVNLGTAYHVFLTPKGDCKGLYVTNETATGFEVRELGKGRSTIAFDYRIVARRKGYESIRLADRTEDMKAGEMGTLRAKQESKRPIQP